MKYVVIGFLKVWRFAISPLYGNVCRYYPSCSAYALRAVQYHGAVKGTWYGARRLLRCHPWAAGGYDPVPGTPEFDDEMREQGVAAATIDRDQESGAGVDGGAGGVSTGINPHDERPYRDTKARAHKARANKA